MARKFEFSVDMHVHSIYSGESLARPRDIVEAALEKGLDAICITEHESLSVSRPFEEFRGKTPLTILRGVEIATDSGHMLVYGVSDKEWGDWGKRCVCRAQDLIDRVNLMGGVVVPAHPYVISCSHGSPYCWDPLITVDDRVEGLRNIAALEVCNGKQLAYPCICEMLGALARDMGLPGTGGSDAHIPSDVGRSYTVFRTPVYSNADLVRAVKSGLLHPKNHGIVYPLPKATNISAR